MARERRLLVDDEHEELLADQRLELGERHLLAGGVRVAHAADRREAALVDGAAGQADIEQRPDQRLRAGRRGSSRP